MDKKKLAGALSKLLEEKGKRKFKQTVELIINTRGINFSKTENRFNLDVPLPHGKGGKEPKVAVIGDEEMIKQAKKLNVDLVVLPNEIVSLAAKERLKDLAKNYIILAQPNLMGQVAKSLGQYLGPRGKLPQPIVSSISELIERSKRSVRIVSKGKYLPVAQAMIGTETMTLEALQENAESVYDAIKNKTGEGNIKSIYVKLTMSQPVRVM